MWGLQHKGGDMFKRWRESICLCLTGLVVFLIFASVTRGGVTGKIAGVTIDKETKNSMPGVTVQIIGTTMGTFSTQEGEYFIINVPVGDYSIKATSVGYAPLVIEKVHVTADQTTTLNLELIPQAVQMEEIRVVAERPLIQRDQTGSQRVITTEEFANLPLRDFREAAALQAGVVKDAAGVLYVRGGRSNEVVTFIDGFSQQNPLTGLSTVQLNPYAVEEVQLLSGGFSAQYGRMMSGVVNTITKSGTVKYHGMLGGVTDNFAGNWLDTRTFDYNVYEGAFSGPLRPNDDRYTFSVSGERRWVKDWSPSALADGPLPNNSSGVWIGQGKFNLKFTTNLNVVAGGLFQQEKLREYRHEYLYNAVHMPRVRNTNKSAFVKLTHTLSKKTFYDLSGNWFFTERIRGDGMYFDDLKAYGRTYGNPANFIGGSDEALFWISDNPATPIVRNSEGFITSGDEAHIFPNFLKQRSSYIGGTFNLTSQVTPHHQVQGGLDFQRHTLRRYNHLIAYNVGSDNQALRYQDVDYFGYDSAFTKRVDGGLNGAKHPVVASAYLQDKIEYQQTIVNFGLRYDFLSSETEQLKSSSRPLDPDNQGDTKLDSTDLIKNKVRHRISPRLGIAFPISENTQFHLNYGKFYQLPNLEDLYVNYGYLDYKIRTGGYYFAFGNPNLTPEKTTAYEVGITQKISENARFDITAYYKDVAGLVEVQNIPSFPSNYASFRNNDFGSIKGIDLGVKLRRTRAITIDLNYSLSYATGTGSTSQTQRNIAWTASQPPKLTAPLDFDQRHKFSIVGDIRGEKGQGPVIAGQHILENAGLNLLVQAGSGLPYTPTRVYNEVTLAAVASDPSGPINSSYRPWTFRIDVKANKMFSYRGFNLDMYIWVLNLTNTKNAIRVYTSSGSGLSTNWLSTAEGQDFINKSSDPAGRRARYLLAEQDPGNFDIPRMVRFGTRISF